MTFAGVVAVTAVLTAAAVEVAVVMMGCAVAGAAALSPAVAAAFPTSLPAPARTDEHAATLTLECPLVEMKGRRASPCPNR